jgi:hypothetical protein
MESYGTTLVGRARQMLADGSASSAERLRLLAELQARVGRLKALDPRFGAVRVSPYLGSSTPAALSA